MCRQLGASFVGVEVVDSGSNLGRVAVSKQDFAAGDIVLADVPAIVFSTDNNSYLDLFIKYLDASPPIQESILDLHHSLLPQTRSEDLTLRTREHYIQQDFRAFQHKDKHLLTMDIARKLVSIVGLNAHGYHPGGQAKVPLHGGIEGTALYVLASKVEHSCAPNVNMIINKLGLLEYQTQIPLQQGDRITFSYMSGIYSHPRSDRRGFLMTSKSFTCHCKRCVGLDECNPFKCPSCGEQTLFEGGDDGSYKKSIYYCLSCNDEVPESNENVENQIHKCTDFESSLTKIKSMLHSGELEMAHMKCLEVHELIAAHYTQLHWLHPTVWKWTSDVFASLAHMYMQQGMPPHHPKVAENLRVSGYAQLLEAKWTQQIIAVAQGWTSLKDAATTKNSCSVVELKPTPSVSKVKALVNGLISDTTTMRYPNSDIALNIFHAGQDLLLGGEFDEDVAQLYERYWDGLLILRDLGEEERTWIAALIESKGQDNRFPNHLMV